MTASLGRSRALLVVAALAVFALVAVAATTSASHRDGKKVEKYQAKLRPVPHDPMADGGSKVKGIANLLLRRNGDLKVRLTGHGTSASLPHAVHIHGNESAEVAQCPGADRREDIVDDGLIETAEGLDDYGPVLVSFTTRGDTSKDSILALDRFPVSKQNGLLKYKRTFEIPASVASRIDDHHVVIHGEDIDGDGQYGGRTTVLGAPLEGELPVACGEIKHRG